MDEWNINANINYGNYDKVVVKYNHDEHLKKSNSHGIKYVLDLWDLAICQMEKESFCSGYECRHTDRVYAYTYDTRE